MKAVFNLWLSIKKISLHRYWKRKGKKKAKMEKRAEMNKDSANLGEDRNIAQRRLLQMATVCIMFSTVKINLA